MVTNTKLGLLNSFEFPSMDFFIKKEFSHFKDLRKTIEQKEIQFKKFNQCERDFGLISMQLEKELGELYAEFIHVSAKLNGWKTEEPISTRNQYPKL